MFEVSRHMTRAVFMNQRVQRFLRERQRTREKAERATSSRQQQGNTLLYAKLQRLERRHAWQRKFD